MIIPGILNKNKEETLNDVLKVKDILKTIQIDVCDGVFVESLTWLPKEEDELIDWQDIDYELDLMVEDLNKYILIAAEMGANKVIIHSREEEKINLAISLARDLSLNIAICSDVLNVSKFIDKVEGVQIMGIEHIGKQGQKIKENLKEEVAAISEIVEAYNKQRKTKEETMPNQKENDRDVYIQIDGGMNEKTILEFKSKSIKNFVVGSALFKLKPTEILEDKISALIEAAK